MLKSRKCLIPGYQVINASVENIFVLTKKLFDVLIEENGENEDCGDLVK